MFCLLEENWSLDDNVLNLWCSQESEERKNMCVGNTENIIGNFGVVEARSGTSGPSGFHRGQRGVSNSAGKSSS